MNLSIADFPGYGVDSNGEVWSRGRKLKGCPNENGYLRVFLRRDKRTHTRYVHRLICEAFHGASGGQEVRHLNGKRDDNRPENLCWGSRADNAADMLAHGTRLRGETGNGAIMSNEMVIALRDLVAGGASMKEAAATIGVPEKRAVRAITGQRYAHLGGAAPSYSTVRRFSDDEVREIRAAKGRETQQALADRFGVARNAIWQIQAGKTYRHL